MIKRDSKSIGLIISSRSIVAVEVENGKNGFIVSNYSKVILEEGIVESDCIILNQDAFREAVKKLLKTGVGGAISAKEIFISIPEEKIFTHQVAVPRSKMNDLDFIKETAKDFIPIELDQAVFDYKMTIDNREDKTVILNVVAVQNSIVNPLVNSLKKLKLTVIGIDYDTNCLIRSFNNQLNENSGDFLIVHSDLNRDLIAINTQNDNLYSIIHRNDEKELLEKIRALVNVDSTEKVRELLLQTKKENGFNIEEKEDIKKSLKKHFDELETKIKQFLTITKSKDVIDIKLIYLTGTLSALPGMIEMLREMFPKITIKKKIQFTEIPDEIEDDALEGIGLCLKGQPGMDKNDFNLLPDQKKEELNISRITPKLRAIAITITLLMIALVINVGLSTARKYVEFHTSSKEATILNEKTLNPYITQTASAQEFMRRADNQILSIIEDTVPVSPIMEYLDSYNKTDVHLVSISFDDRNSGTTAMINLRAKAANRETTEKLVEDIEKTPLISKVESPLTNLIGKGERPIEINLILDKTKIRETATNEKNTEINEKPENTDLENIEEEPVEEMKVGTEEEITKTEESPRKPSIPVIQETDE